MMRQRIANGLRRSVLILVIFVTLVVSVGGRAFANAVCPQGMSDLDCNSLLGNWPDWVPDNGSSACGSSDDTETTDGANSTNTAAQKIASTFIVGLSAADPKTAQAVATDLATKYRIGGTYLVNTHDAAGAGFTSAFYASLNKAAGTPLVTASDEEGGSITRYDYGSTSFPSAGVMAKKSDAAVEAIGKSAGAAMAANGLTTDLAPVLDLRDVAVNNRSFSNKPAIVADKAGAFAAGLEDSKIKPIFKHFPGFDSTTSGTTDNKKVVMKGSIDKTVAPYKTLLEKYPDAGVMLSNMYVNKLDADNPSSLSAATVKYVRSTLGFKGLITTDDLSVDSVVNKANTLGNAVATSLQAGVTMPLFNIDSSSVAAAEASMDKIIAAVQKNSAAVSAADNAQAAITAFKGASAPPAATNTTSSGACCGTTTLAGGGNEAKIWNYFIGKGLSAAGTAGMMGNWKAESHFDPSIEQNPGAWEDLSSNDVNHGGKGGVGLVQWDGGRRPAVIKYMMKHGLTDADFHHASDKLLGAELDYVWKELNGPYQSTLATIQKDTDPGQAAYDFHKGYEGSSDSEAAIKEHRMDPAVAYYKQFNGSSVDTGGLSGDSGSCAGTSPDCAASSGSAKILCAARAYDTASYLLDAGPRNGKAWHKQCPTIGPSCKIDCSLLVTLAVYDAFGVTLTGTDTSGERAEIGKYWTKVTSLSQVQPGDIMQPETSHVEVVDHVSGNLIYTFGAHTDEYPQPKQVSPATYKYNDNMLFLHFKGADS